MLKHTSLHSSYRYTIWVRFNRTTGRPDFSDVHGEELYNHSDAPVPQSYDMEHNNLVSDLSTGLNPTTLCSNQGSNVSDSLVGGLWLYSICFSAARL